MLLLACSIWPLARLLARLDWRADLLTHFEVAALAATLLALGLAVRRRRLALVLAVLAVVEAAPLARFWGPNPVRPDPARPERLRILFANVLVKNRDHRSLLRLVRQERPDVVGLAEVSGDWWLDLEELRREYPYGIDAPGGFQGLVLRFREPPLAVDGPRTPSPGGWPYLRATFRFAGKPRHLWLVHPASPLRRQGEGGGFPEFLALADLVGRAGGSRIVVGDCNITSGSPYFGDFLRRSGLRDSRLGFGLQPSWPTGWPYQIAIDHAFVSDDLAVTARRIGPAIKSDHLPLIVELAPAEEGSSRNAATRGSSGPSP